MSLTERIDALISLTGTPQGTVPAIRNKLFAIRGEVETLQECVRALEADTKDQILAAENDRLQAALEAAHEQIDSLRHEKHLADELLKKKPTFEFEPIERPPGRMDGL